MRDVILQNISEYFLRINFETENCAAQFSSRFSSRMEAVFHFLQQYIRGQFLRNVEEGVSSFSQPSLLGRVGGRKPQGSGHTASLFQLCKGRWCKASASVIPYRASRGCIGAWLPPSLGSPPCSLCASLGLVWGRNCNRNTQRMCSGEYLQAWSTWCCPAGR